MLANLPTSALHNCGIYRANRHTQPTTVAGIGVVAHFSILPDAGFKDTALDAIPTMIALLHIRPGNVLGIRNQVAPTIQLEEL